MNAKIRVNDQIRIESRRLQANRDFAWLENQPQTATIAPSEVELDNGARRRQEITTDSLVHFPKQQHRIQLFLASRNGNPTWRNRRKRFDGS
jgi:hypothetical protein